MITFPHNWFFASLLSLSSLLPTQQWEWSFRSCHPHVKPPIHSQVVSSSFLTKPFTLPYDSLSCSRPCYINKVVLQYSSPFWLHFIILSSSPPLLTNRSRSPTTLSPQRLWIWGLLFREYFLPRYSHGPLSHSGLCSMSAPQKVFSSLSYLKKVSSYPPCFGFV